MKKHENNRFCSFLFYYCCDCGTSMILNCLWCRRNPVLWGLVQLYGLNSLAILSFCIFLVRNESDLSPFHSSQYRQPPMWKLRPWRGSQSLFATEGMSRFWLCPSLNACQTSGDGTSTSWTPTTKREWVKIIFRIIKFYLIRLWSSTCCFPEIVKGKVKA